MLFHFEAELADMGESHDDREPDVDDEDGCDQEAVFADAA